MFKITINKDAQTTLKKSVFLKGISPYTGNSCQAWVYPSKENTGLVFQVKENWIPATYQFLKKDIDSYTTILQKGKLEIKTVEHLLSALWGLGIDNAVIKLQDGQIPFVDASAEHYTKLLNRAGKKELAAKRKYLTLEKEKAFFYKADPKRYAVFKPADKLSLSSTSVFDNIIGRQEFSHHWSPEIYEKEVSWARSFLNSPIKESGGEKWERVRQQIKVLPTDPRQSPLIVYTNDKCLTPLKTSNECARHKVLDFYGDIALLGIRIKARITLYKPGHEFNRQIVSELASNVEKLPKLI